MNRAIGFDPGTAFFQVAEQNNKDEIEFKEIRNENNPITGFTVLGTLSKYKKSSLITSSIILLGILGSFGFFKYRKFKVSQKSKK